MTRRRATISALLAAEAAASCAIDHDPRARTLVSGQCLGPAAPSGTGARLVITAPGLPVAQSRHRTQVIALPGRRPFAHHYTPDRVMAWRRAVLAAARATPGYPAEPWTGAVRLSMEAFFERPQRLSRKSDPDGPIRMNVRPDADNLAKAVMDALSPPPRRKKTGNAAIDEAARRERVRGYLWLDDGQVHLGPVERWYAAKGCGPGVIICAERLDDVYRPVIPPCTTREAPC